METSKIKAEIVTEFEFKKDNSGLYSSDFSTHTDIKVNNLVGKLYFRYSTNYDKEPIDGNRPIETIIRFSDNMTPLIEAGFEIDVTHIIEKYEKRIEELKVEQEITKHNIRKNDYKISWIHKGIADIVKYKNTHTISDLSYTHTSEEDFLKGSNREPILRLVYKGESVSIDYEQHLTGSWRHPRNVGMKYKMWFDNKERRYTKFETLIKKFVELVDTQIIEKKWKAERADKADQERKELVKEFYSIIGEGRTILQSKDWYQPNYGGRHDQGYYKYTHYVKLSEDRKISISKWNDTYTLGSIGKLSGDQVKRMLDIISE